MPKKVESRTGGLKSGCDREPGFTIQDSGVEEFKNGGAPKIRLANAGQGDCRWAPGDFIGSLATELDSRLAPELLAPES